MKHAESALQSSGRNGGDSRVLESPAAGVLQKIPTATDRICVALCSLQRLLDVGNQILDVLEPDGESEQIRRARTAGTLDARAMFH